MKEEGYGKCDDGGPVGLAPTGLAGLSCRLGDQAHPTARGLGFHICESDPPVGSPGSSSDCTQSFLGRSRL